MSKIQPAKDEDALAFVERADSLRVTEEEINRVLKHDFGFSDAGEIKTLKLRSSFFWKQFYLEHALKVFERGGSRYAALKFIHRKNAFAEDRRKLTNKEIEALVDSVGDWPR